MVEKSKKSINKERGIFGEERGKILKNYKLDLLFIREMRASKIIKKE